MNIVTLNKISANAFWNVVSLSSSMLVGLGMTALAVREMGLEQYGYFGLITIILAPLAMGGFGFAESLTKFTAEYMAVNNTYVASLHTRSVLFMALLVGGSGAVLVALFGPILLKSVFSVPASDMNDLQVAVYWVSVSWAIQQVVGVFIALAVGLHAFRYVAIGNVISLFAVSAIQVPLLFFGFGLKGFVAGLAIGNLIGLLWWVFTIRRIAHWVRLLPRFDSELWKKSFRFGGWLTMSQVGGIFANQGERFFLGAFLTPSLFGTFNVVLKLEQAAYLVAYKISEVLFPYFSSTGESKQVESATKWLRASWLTTVLGISFLSPLIPFGKSLLEVWVGSEVAGQSDQIVIFLTVAGMLGCITNTSYFFMLGHSRTYLIARLSMATGLTTVIVAWLVLPRFGFAAAAWSGLSAMLLQIVVLTIGMKKELSGRVNYFDIFIWMYVPVIVGFFCAMVIKLLDIQPKNWGWVIADYLICAVSIGIVNLIISRILPGGLVRWKDVLTLFQGFLRSKY
jgi:O-antigen/teichoic acid export membrane protein